MQNGPNRGCPLCGAPPTDIAAYVPAAAWAAANRTYRADWPARLGVPPDAAYPWNRCGCGFLYAGHLPEPAFLRAVYEDVIDAERTYTDSLAGRRLVVDLAAAVLGELSRRPPRKQRPLVLLDFGCGYGALLAAVANAELRTIGFETSPSRAVIAAGTGATVLTAWDDVAAHGPYDAIVCSEVLEHVPDPKETLVRLRAVAGPGARLFVTVPDFSPVVVAAALADLGAGRSIPRNLNLWEHLGYFSPARLAALLDETGFGGAVDVDGAALAAALGHRDAAGPRAVVQALRSASRAVRRLRPGVRTTRVIARAPGS